MLSDIFNFGRNGWSITQAATGWRGRVLQGAQLRTVIFIALLAAALYLIDAYYFNGHYYFALLRGWR
jgi:hypothetical protein